MSDQPTRRDALVQITAGAGAAVALASLSPTAWAQTPYRPKALSDPQFKLLSTLVDMIIPSTDTPGAAAVGVDRMIDEDLAGEIKPQLRDELLKGLGRLEKSGFGDLAEAERVKLLHEYSEASGEEGEFFQALKGLTVDHYYSTEVGIIDELGYQGNTYLAEFPGCTHEEHQ